MEIGHVIMVEQRAVSAYDEIFAEVGLLRDYHCNILGAVVIGMGG